MTARTVYELRVLIKPKGYADFAPAPMRFDELETERANDAFNRELNRAIALVGSERTLTTVSGRQCTALIERGCVELVRFRVGDGWTGEQKQVRSEVVTA